MRQIRVKVLTTNNLHISGNLVTKILPDSYRCRLSDVLNNSRNFVELTDVEVYGSDQTLMAKMPFLCINKPVIALLFEAESSQGSLSGNYNAPQETALINFQKC